LEQLLLPGVDHGRVVGEVPGQFVEGAVALEGGDCDLRLEGRRVSITLACHCFPFPGPTVKLNRWSSFRGPLYPFAQRLISSLWQIGFFDLPAARAIRQEELMCCSSGEQSP